ncbi:MAG: cation:proton antiporter [Gammaproteobacteria bacterium]|nr:cation:proton antiporter [Gammaproteobacteria bacterium]
MIDSMILIFVGATIFAALAMFIRQPLIIIYVLLGTLLGPYALGWVDDTQLLYELSEVGILFLLFIVGLELPPNKLKTMFGTSLLVTALAAALFFVCGMGLGLVFGFTWIECLVLGAALMFSSTVLGIKLLPRTILHHRKIGEIVIGILLLQDLLAALTIVALYVFTSAQGSDAFDYTWLLASGPVLLIIAYAVPKYVLWPLVERFDVFSEFMFLLYIGWCLAVAGIAHAGGLGFELGAFIAGVALANSPVSQSVAQSLEPLRDFFLVLFFFTVGARIDIALVPDVIWQATLIAALMLAIKPVTFRYLLKLRHVRRPFAWEVGLRLGQCSEFSLLVLFIATPLISKQADHVILVATILTMLVSTYIVVLNYRNPLAISESLRVA